VDAEQTGRGGVLSTGAHGLAHLGFFHEQVEPDHERQRGTNDEYLHKRNFKRAKLEVVRFETVEEWDGKAPLLGAEDFDGGFLEGEGDRDGRNQGRNV